MSAASCKEHLDTKREWVITIRRAEMVHKAGNWVLMNSKNDRRVAKSVTISKVLPSRCGMGEIKVPSG